MRVLLDANVYVSALLTANRPTGVIATVIQSGILGTFALVLPDDDVAELRRVTGAKPHLRRKLPPPVVAAFVETIRSVAEPAPALDETPPRVCRDPNDDFLVAQALRLSIDVLVSGDPDLLALEGTGLPCRVLNPRDFLELLEAEAAQQG